jgi:hypothetical protein
MRFVDWKLLQVRGFAVMVKYSDVRRGSARKCVSIPNREQFLSK